MGFNDIARMQIWVSSFYSWLDNSWLFGIGIGNSIFINVVDYYPNPNQALTTYIDNPHSMFLDMLLERGLLGLVTFVIFLSSIFLFQNNNLNCKIFIRTLIFSLLVMGIANITFRYEFAMLFVIMVGAYLNPAIKK